MGFEPLDHRGGGEGAVGESLQEGPVDRDVDARKDLAPGRRVGRLGQSGEAERAARRSRQGPAHPGRFAAGHGRHRYDAGPAAVEERGRMQRGGAAGERAGLIDGLAGWNEAAQARLAPVDEDFAARMVVADAMDGERVAAPAQAAAQIGEMAVGDPEHAPAGLGAAGLRGRGGGRQSGGGEDDRRFGRPARTGPVQSK